MVEVQVWVIGLIFVVAFLEFAIIVWFILVRERKLRMLELGQGLINQESYEQNNKKKKS